MRQILCWSRGWVRAWILPALALFVLLFSPAHAEQRWHFRATIGVDDMVQGRPGAAIFRVFVGDQKVYESPVMKPGDNPITIHIPLRQENTLTLEVADTGDGHGGDWGNWCDARIQDDSGQTTIWLSDLREQVLQEWIATRKDRNIVGQPLKLQGRIYCRGLGTISGSRMRYVNWYAQWQEAQRQRLKPEQSAAQRLRFLKLEGNLHGARLWVNGREVKTLPAPIAPNSTIRLRVSPPAGAWLFAHPVFTSLTCRSASGAVPLRRWLPQSVQLVAPPAKLNLPILNGAPYPAVYPSGGEVVLTYRYPALNTLSALPPETANAPCVLELWCAVRDAGKADPVAQPTVTVSVYEGSNLRARTRLLSRRDHRETLKVPLSGKGELRIVVDDGGDGNLGDEVLLGGVLFDQREGRSSPLTSLPYLLEGSPQESVQVLYYPTAELRAVVRDASALPHSAFRVQAPVDLAFDGYAPAIARLHRADRLVDEAERIWRAGKTSECAERLALAERLDEHNPRIYLLRARMAESAGRADAELRAWKRLVEVSRADLPLRRRAKARIAELYRLLDGNRPEFEFDLPSPPPPDASANALTANIWRVYLKPLAPDSDVQAGELRFTVPAERAGWWLKACIDSRGLALRASIERRTGRSWQLVWATDEPQAFPTGECRLSAGEYRLTVTHEGSSDGVDGAFHVAVSTLLSCEKPAPSRQQWTYRLHTDGSAEVEVAVRGVLAVPVPFTAEGLSVEGARYSLLPPVYEYLSKLELRHAQVLLLQPTGEQATVRFRWLDAAYNVPMTRYAPERKEHFYFRSLAGLGKSPHEMEVLVYLPEGTGEFQTLVPEPQTRDGSLLQFRLPQERMVIINAKHPAMDTRWLSATYRRMTVYIPDTPFYRRWLPKYLALLMRIYGRERQIVGGYEPEDALFVSLTGPAQLSGYGGATWGGPRTETWIACTGRVGPYNLRYESGGDGVEAHELKWVFLHGVGEGLPHWLQTGAVIYIEEQGKLAGDTAYPDVWYQRSLRPGALQFRRRYSSSPTPLQWSESDFRQLPSAQRILGEAMANEIMQVVAQRYGNRVWAELFRRNREGKLGLKELSDRQKDTRIIQTLVEITRDPAIRRLFEGWGFQSSL